MRAQTHTRADARVLPILGAIISLLALADGALHFALDFVMFHGRLWGSPFHGRPPGGGSPSGGPPPGAGLPAGHAGPPPGPHFSLPLPNNELFILNSIGYVVLVIIFWLSQSAPGWWRGLVDAAIAVYAAFSIWAWFEFGAPNPDGLGYIAKALEAALIVVVAAHAWYVVTRPSAGTGSRPASDTRVREPVR
jgi:hypothetical protein